MLLMRVYTVIVTWAKLSTNVPSDTAIPPLGIYPTNHINKCGQRTYMPSSIGCGSKRQEASKVSIKGDLSEKQTNKQTFIQCNYVALK